jgi:hypothetical protein
VFELKPAGDHCGRPSIVFELKISHHNFQTVLPRNSPVPICIEYGSVTLPICIHVYFAVTQSIQFPIQQQIMFGFDLFCALNCANFQLFTKCSESIFYEVSSLLPQSRRLRSIFHLQLKFGFHSLCIVL